jgi:hypothetical protein
VCVQEPCVYLLSAASVVIGNNDACRFHVGLDERDVHVVLDGLDELMFQMPTMA